MTEKYNIDNLIKEYGKKVFNLAYRITGDRQDAEDVTQETFLQVFRKLDSFEGKSHIYTWIYKIALNNSLQVKRRLSRAYMDSLDEKIELFREEIPNEVKACLCMNTTTPPFWKLSISNMPQIYPMFT